VIQLIVRFRREFNVTYSGETFRSTSMKIIEPVNKILAEFPDVRIKQSPSGNVSGAGDRMRSYYAIYLDDLRRAQDLEHKLQSQLAVEAAYIKPPAEPP